MKIDKLQDIVADISLIDYQLGQLNKIGLEAVKMRSVKNIDIFIEVSDPKQNEEREGLVIEEGTSLETLMGKVKKYAKSYVAPELFELRLDNTLTLKVSLISFIFSIGESGITSISFFSFAYSSIESSPKPKQFITLIIMFFMTSTVLVYFKLT